MKEREVFCRGDCNQGRNCYCGAASSEDMASECKVILVAVIAAVSAVVVVLACYVRS